MGFAFDDLRVDAAAVIDHFDYHLVTFVAGQQLDDGRGRLAARGPLIGGLDPVVEAVAYHVTGVDRRDSL